MKKNDVKNQSNTKLRMLCDNLDFVLHEEYRMLRTNIMYSLSDEKSCHCIGITSSLKGEAKSTTAINLAYTLAENGEKVCLLEADMRLPTFKKKLELEQNAGLSEYLTGQAGVNDILRKLTFKSCTLPYIQAGAIPPNPAELLASSKMMKLLDELSKEFKYIIVDLPPINMVSDAIILGGKLDGVVMVVAQPICTKKMLKESMRQLRLARIKVIGFVRTFTADNSFGYSKYKKYGKKYKYYRGYKYQKGSYNQEEQK